MNEATQAPTPAGLAARRWILVLLSLSTLLYLACHAFKPFSSLVLHETGTTPSAGGFFYAYTGILLVELVLYSACLRLMAAGGSGKKTLLVWSLALAFCAAMVWPVVSSDHFQYLSHGRIFALFHGNPMTEPYRCFSGDPLFRYLTTDWAQFPSSYGPLAIFASGLPALLGGDSLLLGFYVSKFLYFLLFAATLLVFYRKAPDARSFFLYAFNPLLLSELLISGHNDLLVVFFLALGWCFLDGDRSLKKACLVFGFWSLALFVKITPVILMPFLWVYLAAGLDSPGKRTAFACLGALLFAALFAALYLPFWEGPRTFSFPLANFGVLGASGKVFPAAVPQGVVLLLGDHTRETLVTVQKYAFASLFAALVVLFVRYLRDVFRNRRETVLGYLSLACVLFLLLSPSYVPWYVCMGVFVWSWAACDKGMTFKISAYLTAVFSLMGILDYLTLR